MAAPRCHHKPAEIYFGCDGWGDLEAGAGRTKKVLSVERFQACAGIPRNRTMTWYRYLSAEAGICLLQCLNIKVTEESAGGWYNTRLIS
jgi:hypothetical protein